MNILSRYTWPTRLSAIVGLSLTLLQPVQALEYTLAYVANVGSNTVSVIDPATNRVVATVPVGVSPQGVAVSPVTNRVYVTNFNSGTVSVIDTASNTVCVHSMWG